MPLLLPPFTIPIDGAHGAPVRTLRVRLLAAVDLAAVVELRNEVLARLQHPDCYVRERDEEAFLRLHLPPHGATVGVFEADRLVAYAMLGLPAESDPGNLAKALNLGTTEQAVMAHLSSCMVRPAWRGLGLQRALLGARLALARSLGRRLCGAVVSLHNHSSRHNMLRRGLHLASVDVVDGLRRQIALIDLDHGLHVDPGDEVLIGSTDFSAQRRAIAKGYVGVGESRHESGIRLRFVRRLDVEAPAAAQLAPL